MQNYGLSQLPVQDFGTPFPTTSRVPKTWTFSRTDLKHIFIIRPLISDAYFKCILFTPVDAILYLCAYLLNIDKYIISCICIVHVVHICMTSGMCSITYGSKPLISAMSRVDWICCALQMNIIIIIIIMIFWGICRQNVYEWEPYICRSGSLRVNVYLRIEHCSD